MRAHFCIGWVVGACTVLSFVSLTPHSYAQQCVGAPNHPGNLPGPPATLPTICCKQNGPDVIVGDIVTLAFNTGSETISGVDYDAFSFGTTSCNIGNMNVRWDAFSGTTHPAIAQGLFKFKKGKFEQVGMSWLKHGFTALTDNICGCTCNGSGGSVLGVGCADPYTASRNGSQGSLKPRWFVNAHTGVFPSNEPVVNGSGNTYRRLRVKSADLEPSSNSIRYFVECQYVTQDDAYFDNNDNNASHREVTMTQSSATNFDAGITGNTQREQPAIHAWKDLDSDVIESRIQVAEAVPTSNGNQTAACAQVFNGACPPSTNTSSLVIVSSRASLVNGTLWHYEYAVANVNCDASISSFSVPLPPGITLSNIGFHDVDYHSGDGIPTNLADPANTGRNYDGTDWPATVTSNAITWSTVQSFAQNDNGNAIRWATMYNFRFDADRPPGRTLSTGANTLATLGIFKTAGSVTGLVYAPDNDCNHNNVGDTLDLANGTLHDVNANGVPDECEITCAADVSTPHNGVVNVDDLLVVINGWGPCPRPCAAATCAGDINHSCQVNVDDLMALINAWGPCQ